MKKLFLLCAFLSPLIFSACTAKIYIIDRHTIMEDEAAGDWPEFEKDLMEKSKAKGPTPFQTAAVNEKKKRLYNVLNGEMAERREPTPKTGK